MFPANCSSLAVSTRALVPLFTAAHCYFATVRRLVLELHKHTSTFGEECGACKNREIDDAVLCNPSRTLQNNLPAQPKR